MNFRPHHAVVLGLSALLAGCSDPYDARPTATRTASPPLPAGELAGRIPADERRALSRPQTRPEPNSQAALRRYADLVTNWNADDVADRYRAAANAATGQARRDAQQTAATAHSDPQLAGAASRARTVAVVRQTGGWALVITREHLTPDAGPDRYRIYRAHTRPVASGAAVDAWQPQP
jgi:hypothetical protein